MCFVSAPGSAEKVVLASIDLYIFLGKTQGRKRGKSVLQQVASAGLACGWNLLMLPGLNFP
jgi:hypothetical protein